MDSRSSDRASPRYRRVQWQLVTEQRKERKDETHADEPEVQVEVVCTPSSCTSEIVQAPRAEQVGAISFKGRSSSTVLMMSCSVAPCVMYLRFALGYSELVFEAFLHTFNCTPVQHSVHTEQPEYGIRVWDFASSTLNVDRNWPIDCRSICLFERHVCAKSSLKSSLRSSLHC
mgnify:CR=1 FL=1